MSSICENLKFYLQGNKGLPVLVKSYLLSNPKNPKCAEERLVPINIQQLKCHQKSNSFFFFFKSETEKKREKKKKECGDEEVEESDQ